VTQQVPPSLPAAIDAQLSALSSDAHEHYVLRVDGSDPARPLRYIATARHLGIHPFAVITADLAELAFILSAARSAASRSEPK
jgi:hypothetical protein